MKDSRESVPYPPKAILEAFTSGARADDTAQVDLLSRKLFVDPSLIESKLLVLSKNQIIKTKKKEEQGRVQVCASVRSLSSPPATTDSECDDLLCCRRPFGRKLSTNTIGLPSSIREKSVV